MTPSRATLIDAFLPSFDVSEHHSTRVHASAKRTFDALYITDLASSPIARMLLQLRAVPAAVLAGPDGVRELRERQHAPVTLSIFERHGFRIVAEDPPHELLIGLEGQFWALTGNLCRVSANELRSQPVCPGNARAAWNFSVRDLGNGEVELATETRVLCADNGVRFRFLPYWTVVRAGSGIIRRLMLRDIRRVAESTA